MEKTILPRITIITPSYNQARYLVQTITSVMEQGYPNLEYIITDGGSTDGSFEIIRKFASRLSYWISEPDRGQSHALNKGFAKATGDILCWINSDDYLEPGTLATVACYFHEHPECRWLVGCCRIVDAEGKTIGMYEPRWESRDKLLRFWETDGVLPQPATFWRREVFEELTVREDLHFAMDYELWLRLSKRTTPHIISDILANYRLQADAKTVQAADKFLPELLQVARPHWRERGMWFWFKCELSWRRCHAEGLYRRAFRMKHAGKEHEAWLLLRSSLAIYPLILCSWRVMNLMLRLTVSR